MSWDPYDLLLQNFNILTDFVVAGAGKTVLSLVYHPTELSLLYKA